MIVDYYFIIAAAGSGTRLDKNNPKQFLEYNGSPLYINIVKELEKNSKITAIIIITKKEYINYVYETTKKYTNKKLYVLVGGKERQDSIYNGILFIKENLKGNAIIAVQDGARPFVKQKYIDKTYEILLENSKVKGVVVGVSSKDTIKIIDENNIIIETPKRDNLFIAHTPQVFWYETLYNAYKYAYENSYYGTDDSSLVEFYGEKIEVLIGDYDNIKITTKEDLLYLNEK